ncbi:putative fatty acyl-CoA reductase CG5065 [Bombus vancouverensis nearcticus]|uniref:Fatty acyl-CoA reductase n=1 Tax=Bombus bifarius TaxID=103933 RepID=A0A6P8MWX6_9HYME|nr:putative fatty acyl-CoA reductase CG5065 [Bombus vancouverensis nearcticus]XP_033318411.1 putative fatty acyl-CoA reductase CG5065 [Bombus bifarius]XP_050488732.1 putative fatty acyl-CoA reductase CG5065 [Bombus huntii]
MNTEFTENLNKVNSIEGFYAGTGIFITGASGFVGKGLLEKLIRVCPRIVVIFILVRPKKHQTMEQRYKEIIDDPIFDDAKAKNPSALKKVHPVEGDISLPKLGLSQEDRNMLIENVNILFHVAATLNFKEPLNAAVNTNVKGTFSIIELCNELKHVISVIHVSTAYSNANLPDIEEKVYSTSIQPSSVIEICDSLDKESIELLEERILKIHPNTYTFTKNLAEQIVSSNSKSFPVAIVRPSIISASLKEPCPGWLGNITIHIALGLFISRGFAKIALAKADTITDTVPADYVVDTILCAAWHVTRHRDMNIKVYNCTNNARPIKYGELKDTFVKYAIEIPMDGLLWYPWCAMVSNRYVYSILTLFLHTLPAFIVDIFLRLRGSKPRMMKISKYYDTMSTVTNYFSIRQWSFKRDNVIDMMKEVKTLEDSDIVELDLQDMDWDKYIAICVIGIKKFIFKEDPKSLDAARRRLSIFYWLHQMTKAFAIIILLTIILRVMY